MPASEQMHEKLWGSMAKTAGLNWLKGFSIQNIIILYIACREFFGRELSAAQELCITCFLYILLFSLVLITIIINSIIFCLN